MLSNVQLYQIVFILIASVIGVILTIYDKIAAKVAQRRAERSAQRSARRGTQRPAKRIRVPEAVLVTFGALGGALLMYLTMQLIRHKTRKPKFSVGFPIMIVLQAALLTALNIWVL